MRKHSSHRRGPGVVSVDGAFEEEEEGCAGIGNWKNPQIWGSDRREGSYEAVEVFDNVEQKKNVFYRLYFSGRIDHRYLPIAVTGWLCPRAHRTQSPVDGRTEEKTH